MILQPARRVRGLRRTLIRQIFDAAPADAINLGLGQPDLPTPPAVALAGISGIAHGETSYGPTAGDAGLREEVARRYVPLAGGPDDVIITVGSQEAMFVACATLLDAGDELLYPEPGYPAYPVLAELLGAQARPYPLRAERSFRLDPDDLARRLGPRTRAVIVNEPSNPTGAISSAETRGALAELLARRGVAWISDEVYDGFSYGGEFVSMARIAGSGGLVVSSLSKTMSMTGWRIGWVAGPPELIAPALAVHQYLVTCAPRISQVAARGAFGSSGQAARSRMFERFRQRRELMARELSLLPGLRHTPPDGAFYFFVDVSGHGDTLALSRRILERRNVITVPGVAFGAGAEGFLRLSFAASDDDIREGVRRIGAELAWPSG